MPVNSLPVCLFALALTMLAVSVFNAVSVARNRPQARRQQGACPFCGCYVFIDNECIECGL